MKKIFLIGIPNSGKTTLGRRAAEKLRIPFFDTDAMVCDRVNNPLELFKMAINGQFLAEQLKIVSELVKLNGKALISTGAEAALAPECAAIMKANGTVIHIKRKPDILLAEYKEIGKPSIVMKKKGYKKINMQKEAIRLYAKECSQYETLADLFFENNGTEDEGLEKLLKLIENCGD